MKPEVRDLLIEHIDGPTAVRVNGVKESVRHIRIRGLVQRKLLRFDHYNPPRQTFITDAGRAELAKALADWAEALSRAKRHHP